MHHRLLIFGLLTLPLGLRAQSTINLSTSQIQLSTADIPVDIAVIKSSGQNIAATSIGKKGQVQVSLGNRSFSNADQLGIDCDLNK